MPSTSNNLSAPYLVRVADSARLSGLETAPPDLLERYPQAVSIGVALSNSIMDQIDQHPTPFYSSHYGRVNALLDDLAIRATDMLQAGGAEAIPIPASMIPDDKKWTSFISHKAVAIAAGVGWQGKCIVCRDNCPAQAIRGVGTTSHYNSRSEAVDLDPIRIATSTPSSRTSCHSFAGSASASARGDERRNEHVG